MPHATTGPAGLSRRRRRLSDQETRDRMLRAAREAVHRTGLTVSLEHISFEDVIRDAGVARSTAYRHWPQKELFLADLVQELARNASPQIIHDEAALMLRIIAEHRGDLQTPQARHRLLLELFRQLALLDFEAVLHSPDWRTYLALHATCSSIGDGELREQLRAALAESQRAHITQVADAWQHLATLFGYRWRPEVGEGFDTLATLLSATLRGLVITAASDPGVGTRRVTARPFGAESEEEWSLVALGLGSIAMTFIEPDPAVEWDADRLARIRRGIDTWASGPESTDPAP